jgi:hypothetical protein
VRVDQEFCCSLVREWRLRHARIMTCDAAASEREKAEAVAAVAGHTDAFKACTVPQLHLPTGIFHPTVEQKQLEHSDVRQLLLFVNVQLVLALIASCRFVCFRFAASTRNLSTARRCRCSSVPRDTRIPTPSSWRPDTQCVAIAHGSTARGSLQIFRPCPPILQPSSE